MTLIVAIEPDLRQANYLIAMVRHRLKAELMLAESANEALRALEGRVPDVILTSALLSPKDESDLADWLRTLGAAAAHVQTLTIPVFATARQRVRGMFATLRGSDRYEMTAPDGCDPATFADQCADYLERARARRAQHAESFQPEKVSEREEAVEPEVMVQAIEPTEVLADPTPDEFVEFESLPEETLPKASSESDAWVPPQLGVERQWPRMTIPEVRPEVRAAATPQPPARRIPRGPRPIQDEWGFFDPEQCGFSALLARLQEITEGDDPPAKRPA